jgi:hypothetical protein
MGVKKFGIGIISPRPGFAVMTASYRSPAGNLTQYLSPLQTMAAGNVAYHDFYFTSNHDMFQCDFQFCRSSVSHGLQMSCARRLDRTKIKGAKAPS